MRVVACTCRQNGTHPDSFWMIVGPEVATGMSSNPTRMFHHTACCAGSPSPHSSARAVPRRTQCRTLLLAVLAAHCLTISVSRGDDTPAPNPIQRLFKQLDKQLRQPTDPELNRIERDQLDVRVPQDADLARRVTQAERLLREKKWSAAIDVLQFLLEQKQDWVIETTGGNWTSGKAAAEGLLLRLPPAAQREYSNRFDAIAEAALLAARKQGSEAALSRVATRYLSTPAGRSALEMLGLQRWNEGESLAAASAFRRLADHSPLPRDAERNRARAALAYRQANLPAQARKELEQLSQPERWIDPTLIAHIEQGSPLDIVPDRVSRGERAASLEPLLLPSWQIPIIEQYAIEDQVETLLRDLRDQNRAPLSAAHPIGVNGRLLFRDYRGIRTVDPRTGQMRWEAPFPHAPEQLLSNFQNGIDREPIVSPYNGGLFEHHPLASLIFRDTVYSSLSHDHRHVFGVHRHAVMTPHMFGGFWRRRRDDTPDPLGRDWQTNELVAYDVATGHPRWIVGGRKIEDPFSRPLAGTFFFGAATPAGNEVFAVGEREGDVRLECLHATTGEPLWSQILATASRPIHEDTVRRFWACSPVVSDDLVICPTTTGWLVAVDRYQQRLRWVFRYAPRTSGARRMRGGYAVQSVQELNTRWLATQPIIVGDSILFTPPELPDEFGMTSPIVLCLERATGQLQWKAPKEDFLQLAAVVDDLAILIGKNSVRAIMVHSRGRIAWQTSWPEGAEPPSGQAVVLGNELHVPASRELISFEIASGDLISRRPLAESAHDLGNLLRVEDVLVSLSPTHLAAFPLQQQESTTPRAPSPPTLANALRRIAIESMRVPPHDAIIRLNDVRDNSPADSWSPETRETARKLEWDLWIAHLQQRASRREDVRHIESPTEPSAWRRLAELARTPHEQEIAERWRADGLRDRGAWADACAGYLRLLADSSDTFFDEGERQVRVAEWAAGRIADLFEQLPREAQAECEQLLTAFVTNIDTTDTLAANQTARRLLFHPIGQRFALDLTASSAPESFVPHTLLLQAASSFATDSVKAEIDIALARLYAEHGHAADAQQQLFALQKLPEAVQLSDGRPARDVARALASELQLDRPLPTPRLPDWGSVRWQLDRIANSGHRVTERSCELNGRPTERARTLRFQAEASQQRLRIEDGMSGALIWSLPLRSISALEHNPNVGLYGVGPLLLTMHRGALHALDVTHRNILWTFVPHVEGLSAARLRTPATESHSSVQSLSAYRASHRLGQYRSPTGYLLTANAHVAVVLTRDLMGLDPLTGEVLWILPDPPRQLVGYDCEQNILVTAIGEQPQMRRARDGRPVSIEHLEQRVQTAIACDTEGFVSLELATEVVDAENSSSGWVLNRTRFDGTTVWKHDLHTQTLFGALGDDEVCLLSPEGHLSLVELQDGTQTRIGTVPPELIKKKRQIHILSDPERLYVIVDHGDVHAVYLNLASLRVTGTLLAFSRNEPRLLWTVDTLALGEHRDPASDLIAASTSPNNDGTTGFSLNILTQDFDVSPFIVMAGERAAVYEGIHFRRLRLVCLDKRTGEVIIDWARPSHTGGFAYFNLDVPRRDIDIRTYNDRFHIYAIPAPQ